MNWMMTRKKKSPCFGCDLLTGAGRRLAVSRGRPYRPPYCCREANLTVCCPANCTVNHGWATLLHWGRLSYCSVHVHWRQEGCNLDSGFLVRLCEPCVRLQFAWALPGPGWLRKPAGDIASANSACRPIAEACIKYVYSRTWSPS